MRTFRAFVAASVFTWVAGCSGGLATSPTSPPEAITYLVSGRVLETVDGNSRPVGNTLIFLYVEETVGLPAGVTLHRSVRELTTDRDGRYTAQVPRSRVFVYAWGKQQPCIASASVVNDTVLDVEVFPEGNPGSPPPAASPLITGVVYEATPDGRRPLRGATAWLDLGQDAYVANTETDATGRFFFCRVNARARMDVFADGYQPYQYGEFIQGTGDVSFEFEFRR